MDVSQYHITLMDSDKTNLQKYQMFLLRVCSIMYGQITAFDIIGHNYLSESVNIFLGLGHGEVRTKKNILTCALKQYQKFQGCQRMHLGSSHHPTITMNTNGTKNTCHASFVTCWSTNVKVSISNNKDITNTN
jgi:hypothetical protein